MSVVAGGDTARPHLIPQPKMRRLGAALTVATAAIAGCNGNAGLVSGHAERVDVPIVIRLDLTPGRPVRCNPRHCQLRYVGELTTTSDEPVWARKCRVEVLDADGQLIGRAPFDFGPPAGAEVQADQPTKVSGSMQVDVAPWTHWRRAADLDVSCTAYVWHGEVPI